MGLLVKGHICWMVNIPSSHDKDLKSFLWCHSVQQCNRWQKRKHQNTKTHTCLFGLFGLLCLFGFFGLCWCFFFFLTCYSLHHDWNSKKGLRSENRSLYKQKSNVNHLKHECVFSSCWTQKWDQLWLGSWQYMAFSQNRLPRTHHFHARRLDSSSRRSVLMQLTDWFRDIS